jgi:hypothetical protein
MIAGSKRDFEHKQATVVIHYVLDGDEDPDYVIGRAGELATRHVFGMLRARPGNDGNESPASGVPSPAVDPAALVSVEIDVPPAPPVTNLKAAKRVAKAKAEAAAIHDAEVVEPVVETSPVIEVDDFTAVAPAPTDAELGQALSRVNAKLKDRPRIEALLGTFVQSGERFTKIPDVRRADFLARLNALA